MGREKREREKVEPEPVVVKQEPVELPDPMMAGVVIKQEPHSLDERADTLHGDMEVPEFLQDPGPSAEIQKPKPKKHKKEKKKKHKKEKKKKEDRGVKEEIKLGRCVSRFSARRKQWGKHQWKKPSHTGTWLALLLVACK